MWLTGFDAPCMHTMYVDKPMSGHNLMQAIARVNRVFKNKPGGLIVDYLGLAAELKKALAQYTQAGPRRHRHSDRRRRWMCCWRSTKSSPASCTASTIRRSSPARRRSASASSRRRWTSFLQQDDGQNRFVQAVTELSKAFALVATHDDAVKIREEVAFFQCLRAQFAKLAGGDGGGPTQEDLDAAVRQIISRVGGVGRGDRHLRRGRHGPARYFDSV